LKEKKNDPCQGERKNFKTRDERGVRGGGVERSSIRAQAEQKKKKPLKPKDWETPYSGKADLL